ncbi:hypothetical protein PM082_003607 [Marasmius tenuissimus]|nr:hypothetical protein PM082_003607 [Marasmius tenuissimus]
MYEDQRQTGSNSTDSTNENSFSSHAVLYIDTIAQPSPKFRFGCLFTATSLELYERLTSTSIMLGGGR